MAHVGLITYTDPRPTQYAGKRENFLRKKHKELKRVLAKGGFKVVDANEKLVEKGELFGLRSPAENQTAINLFKGENIDALVICIWHWTEPQLPLQLAKQVEVPLAVYTEKDPAWAGAVGITAVGASFWESSATNFLTLHQRFLGEEERLIKWLRGVCAWREMLRGAIMLWGGSYCLRMEHLQDDIPLLKNFLIGDILQEDQYMLIRGAEEILEKDKKRVDKLARWLERGGMRLECDGKMLTPQVWERQLALYLAARDRLRELEEYNLMGVSIKCQPEISEVWGTTACTLPAFLPFAEDSEGKQTVYPTVCEGDIKGLLTCVMFHRLNPSVPPLFGDLKFVGDEYLILSNCGASSIYYANNSLRASETLPHVCVGPQCQGASGGAIGYLGKGMVVTLGRLGRVEGQYVMQISLTETLEFTKAMKSKIIWGQTWPHVAVRIEGGAEEFVHDALANHYILTPGDIAEELSYACELADIEVDFI